MKTLNQEIEKHIKKLVNPLKDPEELLAVLKVKLTKKELKMLKSWADEVSAEEIQTALHLDEEHYGDLYLVPSLPRCNIYLNSIELKNF